MRRAFLLLPRLQSSSTPALVRPFASSASHPAQPKALDATEDHSRDGMVSASLKKMRLAYASPFLSNECLACIMPWHV
jgi:hypothetical protein